MGAMGERNSGATYWADWQYTTEEWQRFDAVEQRHTWHLAGQQLTRWVVVGLVFCLGPVLLGFFQNYTAGEKSVTLGTLTVVFGCMVIGGLWRAWCEYDAGQAMQKERRQGPCRVRISPGTIQIGAMKSTIITNYKPRELAQVTLRAGQPAVLRFTTLTAKRSLSARRYTLWVPVPAGHEAEAAALAERFRREVIGKDRIYWDTSRASQQPPRPRAAAHPTPPLPPCASARKPKKP